MVRLAATTPVAGLGELRHLHPATVAALRAAVHDVGPTIEVSEDHPLDLEDWPSRAGVDVALTPVSADGSRGAPALLALAWIGGTRTLDECAWDVARLAAAVARGRAAAAFLVACAPTPGWGARRPGVELFERGTLTVERLRAEPYRHHWLRAAQERRPQPARLPLAVVIQPFARLPMSLAGDPWELRCVRISVARDVEWIDVAPLPVR
jgi:hypothetical protein